MVSLIQSEGFYRNKEKVNNGDSRSDAMEIEGDDETDRKQKRERKSYFIIGLGAGAGDLMPFGGESSD